jgi:hypothetical protein
MKKAAASPNPSRARAPKGAPVLPSGIDHLAAQAELDAFLFPHYLLGRQLALEEVVRELLLALPPAQRASIVENLRFNADMGMERLTDGITDPKDEAATCGYVATLLQQGL